MPGVAYIRLAKNGFWKLDLSCFPVDTAGSGSRPLPSSMAAVDVVKEITGRTCLCWRQGQRERTTGVERPLARFFSHEPFNIFNHGVLALL